MWWLGLELGGPGRARLVWASAGLLVLGAPSCTASAPADASTNTAARKGSSSGGTQPTKRDEPARAPTGPGAPSAGAPSGRSPSGVEQRRSSGVVSIVTLHAAEGEVVVQVEVVKTQAERARGLMFRERMPEDAGMLFLFRAPEHQTFWMRNTYIPLDMVFIGADRRVVGVAENAAPRTDTTREVDGDSQYVLEVNAGFARRWGVGSGTLVEFGGVDETGVDP